MVPTCFEALDTHVIGGAADRVALTGAGQTWTYARLLEEVAAFGGVLRHCGVTAGDRVLVALPAVPEAVVTVLACARIGATHALVDPATLVPDEPVKVLVTASSETYVAERLETADRVPDVVLVKQRADTPWPLVEGRDYDWDVVMRAGRTDPAPCLEGATVTPYDEPTAAWVQPLVAGATLDLG
ncbi:AMP-binding protein [Nocardioides sp.]|uniref:AMP-binding protein n=1 Tax=Nocardioides sp. TaxID=35761 RepID=UPI002ED4EEF2